MSPREAQAGTMGATLEFEDEDWDQVIDVNLRGVFLMCRRVIPLMKEQGGGAILNIASTAAVQGYPNSHHYTTPRAGWPRSPRASPSPTAPADPRQLADHRRLRVAGGRRPDVAVRAADGRSADALSLVPAWPPRLQRRDRPGDRLPLLRRGVLRPRRRYPGRRWPIDRRRPELRPPAGQVGPVRRGPARGGHEGDRARGLRRPGLRQGADRVRRLGCVPRRA